MDRDEYPVKPEPRTTFTFRIRRDTKQEFQRLCEEQMRTPSKVLEHLVKRWVESQKEEHNDY